MSRELWISHASVARWLDAGLWEEYFAALEDIFGEGLTYLDDKDPARRRAESDRGPFMVTFGPGEESRWLLLFSRARECGAWSVISSPLNGGITRSTCASLISGVRKQKLGVSRRRLIAAIA